MATTECGFESTRGVTLSFANSASGPFTEIGAIEVMPELNLTAGTDTCTDPYAADDEAWAKEFKTGSFDGGDASFTVNIVGGDGTQQDLEDAFYELPQKYLRINMADAGATKRTFPYLVKGLNFPLPPDGGKAQMVMAGKVNGRPVKS